jgi:hypothetical protein
MSTDDEQTERRPVPRAWREEFDGLKPIRPIAYKKPAPRRPRQTEKTEVQVKAGESRKD